MVKKWKSPVGGRVGAGCSVQCVCSGYLLVGHPNFPCVSVRVHAPRAQFFTNLRFQTCFGRILAIFINTFFRPLNSPVVSLAKPFFLFFEKVIFTLFRAEKVFLELKKWLFYTEADRTS